MRAIFADLASADGECLLFLWGIRLDEAKMRVAVVDDSLLDQYPQLFGKEARGVVEGLRRGGALEVLARDAHPSKLVQQQSSLTLLVRIQGVRMRFFITPIEVVCPVSRCTANCFCLSDVVAWLESAGP